MFFLDLIAEARYRNKPFYLQACIHQVYVGLPWLYGLPIYSLHFRVKTSLASIFKSLYFRFYGTYPESTISNI